MKEIIWESNNYGGTEYQSLDAFAPKRLLDKTIVELIDDYSNSLKLAEVRIAELGAGRAPISNILSDYSNDKKYICHAFDKNPDMKGHFQGKFPYWDNFDLLDNNLDNNLIATFDVAVLENVWYSVTLPSTENSLFTENEANLLRELALKKSAALLKPEGVLIISEPLKKTSDFGINRVMNFLECDKRARLNLGLPPKNMFLILVEYLFEKDHMMYKVLKRNKSFMKRANLLTDEEVIHLVLRTGLFDSFTFHNSEDYLKSNGTYVFRRNHVSFDEKHDVNSLGNSFTLHHPIHPFILDLVANFRREVYSNTNTCPYLIGFDEFDIKNLGTTVVFNSMNKLDFCSVATLNIDNGVGLDVEQIMIPENGDFYTTLYASIASENKAVTEALEDGKCLKIAEIRRLASMNLALSDLRSMFLRLFEAFEVDCIRNDVDIVIFLSTEKRAKFFNNANKVVRFERINGFKIDRSNEKVQTILLGAPTYFLKDWEAHFSDLEIDLLNELRSKIGSEKTWKKSIIDDPKKQLYANLAAKLFTCSNDSVAIYYSDYALTRKSI